MRLIFGCHWKQFAPDARLLKFSASRVRGEIFGSEVFDNPLHLVYHLSQHISTPSDSS